MARELAQVTRKLYRFRFVRTTAVKPPTPARVWYRHLNDTGGITALDSARYRHLNGNVGITALDPAPVVLAQDKWWPSRDKVSPHGGTCAKSGSICPLVTIDFAVHNLSPPAAHSTTIKSRETCSDPAPLVLTRLSYHKQESAKCGLRRLFIGICCARKCQLLPLTRCLSLSNKLKEVILTLNRDSLFWPR